MKTLIKSPSLIAMAGGLLLLLAMMVTQGGTASAAERHSQGPAPTTLKLHGAAGMLVHAESGATAPVISTNGHAVNFIEQGTTFVVANQSDIQGNWLDVTVPKAINLDLQGQNTSIQVKGVDGQMVITVNNGTIIITNSTLEGTSKFSGTNSFLSFTGQLDPQSNSTFTGAWVGIQVTLPGDAKLHLKADAHQSGTLTGNFNGLPNNAPSSFDGFLNSNAGDNVATLTFDAQHTSMSLNHQ